MELRGFFTTVFACLFTVEAYSRSFNYRRPVEGDPCTNYDGRYMRINMDECRENKNSQMECPAMADGETRRNSSTHFTLVESRNKLRSWRCISFNNTYSLMVQGNNVSFVNVSCQNGGENVWFKFVNLFESNRRYFGFFIPGLDSKMCLTRSCNGNLSVIRVNSTVNRDCFFKPSRSK
ncbi:unnamed protein product [Porites evermanni]|uniref:Secreted protein n=1 Tax=Porites evermanni TaxID=104178 RepID=A0ABN8S1M6_9CNID|nr:unnamed protein product [Porites evermanni]